MMERMRSEEGRREGMEDKSYADLERSLTGLCGNDRYLSYHVHLL